MEIKLEKLKGLMKFLDENRDELVKTHLRYSFQIKNNLMDEGFERLEVIL